jgi:hypothetical protein
VRAGNAHASGTNLFRVVIMNKLAVILFLAASAVSCRQAGKGSYFARPGVSGPSRPTPRRPEPAKPAVAPEAAWLAQCTAPLDAAKQSVAAILAVAGVRTVDNTLEPWNEVSRNLNNAGNWAHLHSEVNPDAKIREVGRTCGRA